MANISIFKFNHANVRVQLLNGEPLFCLIDVAEILNLSKAASSRFRLTEKGVHKMYLLTNGGKQEIVFVDEPNLYRVIFRSNKKEAIQFQNWIFEEVLPSIRKTGSYSVAPVQQLSESDLTNLAALCNHIRFLNGWWHQYEPAVSLFNKQTAASVHDYFVDGAFVAAGFINKFKLDVVSREYVRGYPFHKDYHSRNQYFLAHSRAHS